MFGLCRIKYNFQIRAEYLISKTNQKIILSCSIKTERLFEEELTTFTQWEEEGWKTKIKETERKRL